MIFFEAISLYSYAQQYERQYISTNTHFQVLAKLKNDETFLYHKIKMLLNYVRLMIISHIYRNKVLLINFCP